jgi:hypothetical protein
MSEKLTSDQVMLICLVIVIALNLRWLLSVFFGALGIMIAIMVIGAVGFALYERYERYEAYEREVNEQPEQESP